jgi:hypothetical protein
MFQEPERHVCLALYAYACTCAMRVLATILQQRPDKSSPDGPVRISVTVGGVRMWSSWRPPRAVSDMPLAARSTGRLGLLLRGFVRPMVSLA